MSKSQGQALKVHPKVGGGSAGALVATIVLWVLNTYLGVTPPPEVATAIGGVMAFAGSYLVSGSHYEAPVPGSPEPPHPNGASRAAATAAPSRVRTA
jgi:hypothetical protein